MAKTRKYLTALLLIAIAVASFDLGESKKTFGSNRKSSSSSSSSSRRQPSTSSSSHVTRPTYNTNSQSHSDLSKLSYSNHNSQPNHGTSGQAAPIGWNVPKQGPPPAYSAHNPVGGAKTNMHEAAPAYRPNNPPSYSSATNVHTPITATHNQGVQSSYPKQQYNAPAGATYHSPGQLPAGATYYSSGHMPAGATYHSPGHMPAGATYYPSGHMPAGASYHPAPTYHNSVPAGAVYYSSPAALPPGAIYQQQAPKSGLGFGTGLAAGAIGGAILGHALTPSHSNYPNYHSQPPVSSAGAANDDKIIIINNGPPGTVTTSENGATIINTQAGQQAAAAPAAASPGNVQTSMMPNSNNNAVPLAAMGDNHNAAGQPAVMPPPVIPGAAETSTEQPQIVCYPIRVNETDPADSTKMIEVEKIACYPAPPPAQNNPSELPPMAPMNNPGATNSQQMQYNTAATQATLVAESASIQKSGVAIPSVNVFLMISVGILYQLLARYGMF